MRSFLSVRISSSPIFYFILLLFGILITAVITLRGIPLTMGTVAYGNLPAFYIYGWSSLNGLYEFMLYPSIIKLFSIPFGVIYAPNIVYFSLLFLPSISIYFFLNELSKSRLYNIVIALVFGTPLNPLFVSYFLGGDFMNFIWLFFFFLSLKFILKYRTIRNVCYLILSGLLYALSSTSAAVFPEALYLTLPFVLITLAYATQGEKPFHRNFSFGIFLLTSTLMLLPIFISTYSYSAGTLSSNTNISSINSYVKNTMIFEFSRYNIFTALFSGVSQPPNGFVTNIYWYIFVTIILVSGGYLSFKKRSTPIIKYLYFPTLFIYFLFAILIILFSYGAIDNFFLGLKIFDRLNYPIDYVVVQQLSLLFLSLSPYYLLTNFTYKGKENVKIISLIGSLPTKLKVLKFKKTYFFSAIILLILLFSSYNIVNASNLLKRDQGSPFLSSNYYSLHPVISNENNYSGYVLILPNTEVYLQSFSAIIPGNEIWNVPQPLPNLDHNYNISLYKEIFTTAYRGNMKTFAYTLGFSGVRLLVVAVSSPNITLIPASSTYSTNRTLAINSTIFLKELLKTKSFSLLSEKSQIYVFEDSYYLNSTSKTNDTVSYYSSSMHFRPIWKNSLNQSEYMNWGGYYSSNDSYLGGKNYSINFSSLSPPHYNLLYIPHEINAPTYGGILNYSYYLVGNLTMSATADVQVFALFYSNHTGFWSDISRVNLQTFNSDVYFNLSVSPPQGSKIMNIVFYTWNSTGTIIKLTKFKLEEEITIQNNSVATHLSMYDMLKNSEVIPQSDTFLPFSENITGTPLSVLSYLYSYRSNLTLHNFTNFGHFPLPTRKGVNYTLWARNIYPVNTQILFENSTSRKIIKANISSNVIWINGTYNTVKNIIIESNSSLILYGTVTVYKVLSLNGNYTTYSLPYGVLRIVSVHDNLELSRDNIKNISYTQLIPYDIPFVVFLLGTVSYLTKKRIMGRKGK